MRLPRKADAAPMRRRRRYSFHTWWMSYIYKLGFPEEIKRENPTFLEESVARCILWGWGGSTQRLEESRHRSRRGVAIGRWNLTMRDNPANNPAILAGSAPKTHPDKYPDIVSGYQADEAEPDL